MGRLEQEGVGIVLRQFLLDWDALPLTYGPWVLVGEAVRGGEKTGWWCPLTAVAHARGLGRWRVSVCHVAAHALGLEDAIIPRIIRAADFAVDLYPSEVQVRRIRRRFLRRVKRSVARYSGE